MTYQYPMERVLYNLHHQLCTYALRKTSGKGRSLAEHILLIFAVCCFGALLLVHLSFVYRGSSGVAHFKLPDGKLLRNIPLMCLYSIEGFSRDADITHVSLVSKGEQSKAFSMVPSNDYFLGAHENSCESHDILYSYSRIKGYLQLPATERAKHRLSEQHVRVSKSDHMCFGEPFLQLLIFGVVGTETVMINWLLAVDDGKGFVYNPRIEVFYDLGGQSYKSGDTTHNEARRNLFHGVRQLGSKVWVVFRTSFLFFITTSLVSFILRETQERMLDFTHQLQARVRSRRPVVNLVLTHLTDNLVFCPVMVGMVFFLIEFYSGDKLLAFMVLSVVWICEVFSVISLRSAQGIHFFPRIFFLLFALFHFYIFSFPFGFSYTALASTICFMIHSMLFFWHRFELPAVALGVVSLEHPRVGRGSSPPIPALQTETAMPANQVPPRFPLSRVQSRGSAGSSNGVMSRQVSAGLFNTGDDGDESYMFFMGGEVVMHRNERRPSLANESANGARQENPLSMDESDSSSSHRNDGRAVIIAARGRGDDDSLVLPPNQSIIEEETSAIRAILDARHSTPRTDNLSRQGDDEQAVAQAPPFPSLD